MRWLSAVSQTRLFLDGRTWSVDLLPGDNDESRVGVSR